MWGFGGAGCRIRLCRCRQCCRLECCGWGYRTFYLCGFCLFGCSLRLPTFFRISGFQNLYKNQNCVGTFFQGNLIVWVIIFKKVFVGWMNLIFDYKLQLIDFKTLWTTGHQSATIVRKACAFIALLDVKSETCKYDLKWANKKIFMDKTKSNASTPQTWNACVVSHLKISQVLDFVKYSQMHSPRLRAMPKLLTLHKVWDIWTVFITTGQPVQTQEAMLKMRASTIEKNLFHR